MEKEWVVASSSVLNTRIGFKKVRGERESWLLVKKFQCKSGQAVAQKSPEKKGGGKFRFLGGALSTDGKVHHLVVVRIRAGWSKIKQLSGILCGRGLCAMRVEDINRSN